MIFDFYRHSNIIVSLGSHANNKVMVSPAVIDREMISDWINQNCEL